MTAWVYILASKRNGTLYVGVTTNLLGRIQQHKASVVEGFTTNHDVKMLVYVEEYPDIKTAREREQTLKRWRRKWKIELIETNNPQWKDLSATFNA